MGTEIAERRSELRSIDRAGDGTVLRLLLTMGATLDGSREAGTGRRDGAGRDSNGVDKCL